MIRGLALLLLVPLLAAFAPVQDRDFMVGSFERIRVDGPYRVTVTQGSSPTARAVGESRRSLEQVSVRVSGSTLIVGAGTLGWEDRDSPARTPDIEIVTPHLRGVTVNGGGQVTAEAMDGDRAEVAINGAGTIAVGAVDAREFRATLIGTGSITASGEARSARLLSNGAGAIDAGSLRAGDLTVVSQASGPIVAQARYNATVLAMGAGTVHVGGGAKCTVSGEGPVTCEGQLVRRR